MRIVVTGGAGFIGSAVCRMLVAERGASVLNVDLLSGRSSLASLASIAASPRYSFRKADVRDLDRMAALIDAFAPDAVVHAAGADNAIAGTSAMLEATHAYWSGLPEARQEKFRFVGLAAKAEEVTQQLVAAWHKSYGLPTIVARSADTFGPFGFTNEAVAAAVTAAIDGNAHKAESHAPRQWVFIDDHVRAVVAMIEKGVPGATYGIAGPGRLDPCEMAERVRQLVARHSGRFGGPRLIAAHCRTEGAQSPAADATCEAQLQTAHLQEETGWRCEETLDSALSKTVRWYLANEAWWRPIEAAQRAGNPYGILRIA